MDEAKSMGPPPERSLEKGGSMEREVLAVSPLADLVEAVSHLRRGNAGCDGVRRHVTGYHCARPHHGSLPDAHPLTDDCAVADPDVIFEDDRARFCPAGTYRWCPRHVDAVITADDGNTPGEHDEVAQAKLLDG